VGKMRATGYQIRATAAGMTGKGFMSREEQKAYEIVARVQETRASMINGTSGKNRLEEEFEKTSINPKDSMVVEDETILDENSEEY